MKGQKPKALAFTIGALSSTRGMNAKCRPTSRSAKWTQGAGLSTTSSSMELRAEERTTNGQAQIKPRMAPTLVVLSGSLSSKKKVTIMVGAGIKGQTLRLVKLFDKAMCREDEVPVLLTALLDGGSTSTIIREKITSRMLGARLQLKEVTVATRNGPGSQPTVQWNSRLDPTPRSGMKSKKL